MKKSLISIVFVVTLVCILVSCSAKNIGSGDISTTDITDVSGKAHYYETVTDENGETVTDNKGNTVYAEIVTDKNNNYVTKENTTVLDDKEKDTSQSETKKTTNADNEVTFSQTQESTTHTTNTTASTTQNETTTQSVTDKDGWINKWY